MTNSTLLVLGGTQWLGREVAAQAIARGYDVTCVARGESGAVPAGAELLRTDRSQANAYGQLAGRRFDFAVEVSWEPRFVAEAVAALADHVGHWTYVSTISVYDESAPPNTESSPRVEGIGWDEMADNRYSAAKVACEDATLAARDAFIPRPGIIGGPGDVSDRLTYWPNRAALAGDGPLLVPDASAGFVQVIDVRDLAAWMLDAAQAGVTGPANAVSPTYSIAQVVEAARVAAGHTGEMVPVSSEFLLEHGVRQSGGAGSLPLWTARKPGLVGMGEHSWERYAHTGGTWRTLEQTVADVMVQERERGIGRPLVSEITRDRELELIAAARGEAAAGR